MESREITEQIGSLAGHDRVEGNEAAICYYRLASLYSDHSSINGHNFVLVFRIFSGVKKSMFAVCLIVWFGLLARWLDWCQIESLSGDSTGRNPCCGNCGVLGERVGAVVC